MRTFILSVFALVLLTGARVFPAFELATQAASIVISTNLWHLRSAGEAEREHFEGKTPHADRLELRFQAEPADHESTLFIRQEDVKLEWSVELNGRKLATLHLLEADLIHAVAVRQSAPRSRTFGFSTLPIRSNGSPERVQRRKFTRLRERIPTITSQPGRHQGADFANCEIGY